MKKFANIKLISCDLDGTILNHKGIPSLKTIEAIKSLHKKEIILVANSGRPIYSIPDEILKLPFDYLVCMNGQYIKNTKTGEIYQKELLKTTDLKLLNKLGNDNFCFSNLHYEDKTYIVTTKMQLIFAFLFDLANRMRFVFKQRKKSHVTFSTNINNIELKDTAKICFISTYGNLKRLNNKLNDKYHGFFVARNWLEVQHSNISKGAAIDDICQLENIDIMDTMAFGDGENDISMLSKAGIGVCMQNGMKATKKVADYIAPSFLEDGFATFINKNIL